MSNATIEKSFCTTREAANQLGVSVGTVQLWVESGLLQAWKTAGGHRRVDRDSVERLIRKPQAPHAPELPRIEQARNLKVVVVEDDPDLLRLYKANLTNWPMRPSVTCFDNATSALMMMGRGGPDLLIVDLHMPGMDGFSMLRVLAKAPEMLATKVVVVSGLDAVAIAERGGVPNGVEVLGKPIPFGRLQEIASKVMSQILISS